MVSNSEIMDDFFTGIIEDTKDGGSRIIKANSNKISPRKGSTMKNKAKQGENLAAKQINTKDRVSRNRKTPPEFSSKKKPYLLIKKGIPPSSLPDSSKRKVNDFRDPRFSDLCGELNLDLFSKSYTFLDEIRKEEKKQLKDIIKSKRSVEKLKKKRRNFKKSGYVGTVSMYESVKDKEEAKRILQRLESQDQTRRFRTKKREEISKARATELTKLRKGIKKKPYFQRFKPQVKDSGAEVID